MADLVSSDMVNRSPCAACDECSSSRDHELDSVRDHTWNQCWSTYIAYQSNTESSTSSVYLCTSSTLVKPRNIRQTVCVSIQSLQFASDTGWDPLTHRRACMVSVTPVQPPGTVFFLTHMTLLTLIRSKMAH